MTNHEIVIIGGGPAGMAAAVAAYDAGCRDVVILDREPQLGGILMQCIHNGFGLHKLGRELTGPEYAAVYAEKVAARNIKVYAETTVTSLSPDRVVTAQNREGILKILAMGCRERSRGALNISGSRPAGIYSAGTAQKLVNCMGYQVGKRVVILGSGDIGLIMARRMSLEGAKVEAVCEVMPYSGGLQRNIVQCLEDFGIPLYLSTTVVQIHGDKRLEGVTIAQVDGRRLPIGYSLADYAQTLRHYGVDKIFLYDHPAFVDFRIEPYTEAFCDFIEKEKPSSILVGATNLGRQLAPRVAARCRTGLTADCTVLEMKENTDLVQIRPAFGGNIMAQIITPNTRPQFCTARYKVFTEPKPTDTASGEIVSMTISEKMLESAIEVIRTVEKPKDVDIAEAEVIVAVGRGAFGEAIRAMATELTDLLGGVVACTRPLVESNVYDAKHQIGLSGRTVKPKLIITLGISGAVQFAAGMKSSDCIVAINSDPNASIFDVAHYCVVGDVNEILPKLIDRIKGVS